MCTATPEVSSGLCVIGDPLLKPHVSHALILPGMQLQGWQTPSLQLSEVVCPRTLTFSMCRWAPACHKSVGCCAFSSQPVSKLIATAAPKQAPQWAGAGQCPHWPAARGAWLRPHLCIPEHNHKGDALPGYILLRRHACGAAAYVAQSSHQTIAHGMLIAAQPL